MADLRRVRWKIGGTWSTVHYTAAKSDDIMRGGTYLRCRRFMPDAPDMIEVDPKFGVGCLTCNNEVHGEIRG
jgi:hypothetical protein